VAIVLAGLGLNLFGETLAILLGQRQVADAPTRAARTTSLVAPGAPILLPQPKDLLLAQGLRVEVVDPRGATTSIVHGLSFSLARGERVGLVGESGSGKTMTALAVARLLDGRARAQADALWYDGHLLIGPDAISGRKARALLGGTLPVVFQDPLGSFNPLLRVGGQVAEAATEHGGLVWKAALSRAIARMDDVGIEAAAARAHQHPHELSGGMLQRCMIAMALMLRPKLIVADEPTTALDVTVQKQVLALLDGVCAETGAGLLLISHDLAVVASVCSRVLVMYAGRIVEDLPVHLLSTGPSHPYTRALLASTLDLDADRASPLRTLPGRAPRSEETVSGCSFASRCALAGPRCSVDEPPLAPLAPGHRAACWRPHLPADAQP
jgi:oligopeptide/dipeptide ABC transporter ATP-binding protein